MPKQVEPFVLSPASQSILDSINLAMGQAKTITKAAHAVGEGITGVQGELMRHLYKITGVQEGSVIMYDGKAVELTKDNFRFTHRNLIGEHTYGGVAGVTASAALHMRYQNLATITLHNTSKCEISMQRAPTVLDKSMLGKELPTLRSIKRWMYKLFGSQDTDVLGVSMKFHNCDGGQYYDKDGQENFRVQSITIKSERKYGMQADKTWGHEPQFLALARVAPVCSKLKKLLEAKDYVGTTTTEGASMTLTLKLT